MPTLDLLPYIFSDTRLPLAVQFERWLQESPRFRLFAETYRDKIRKKVRGVTEPEGYRDLQSELAIAYFLAGERKFEVEYERYGIGRGRGPDFSVTYKTHTRFDVEVTRLRGGDGGAPEPGKLAGTLCAKLLQMPPSMINVLALDVPDASYTEEDLAGGLRILMERAEHKDDEYFTRRGYLGTRDFFKYYSRLSAVRLVTPAGPPILRLQQGARHPLPPDLANILRRT
jgi:hypothetical protein